jgi:hypothetical protein
MLVNQNYEVLLEFLIQCKFLELLQRAIQKMLRNARAAVHNDLAAAHKRSFTISGGS